MFDVLLLSCKNMHIPCGTQDATGRFKRVSGNRLDGPSLSFFSSFNLFLLPATFGFNQRITGSVGWLSRDGGGWMVIRGYFGRWSAAVGGPR